MFEEKRLSSSTLFKTIIFAGVLCLLIIYRGNSFGNNTPKLAAQQTEQTGETNVRQIELTADAPTQNDQQNNGLQAARIIPNTGDAIGDLITGSIEVEKQPTKSIADIANQSTTRSAATTTKVATAEPITSASFTVKSGDTLYSISRKSGVSVARLTAANNIKNNVIRIGQVLNIPR